MRDKPGRPRTHGTSWARRKVRTIRSRAWGLDVGWGTQRLRGVAYDAGLANLVGRGTNWASRRVRTMRRHAWRCDEKGDTLPEEGWPMARMRHCYKVSTVRSRAWGCEERTDKQRVLQPRPPPATACQPPLLTHNTHTCFLLTKASCSP